MNGIFRADGIGNDYSFAYLSKLCGKGVTQQLKCFNEKTDDSQKLFGKIPFVN